MALMETGSVFGLGENKIMKLDLGNQIDAVHSPVQIIGYGWLCQAEQKDEMVPRLVKLFDFSGRGASQICGGYTCSFAISEVDGLCFGGATNTSPESTMYLKAVLDLCSWRIQSLACGKSSITPAADESTNSWNPSPTFRVLGYRNHKPKSSRATQEVKTLDGIFSEQVAMGYSHSLVMKVMETKARLRKRRSRNCQNTIPEPSDAPGDSSNSTPLMAAVLSMYTGT
ncbi:Protein RCC2 [Plecturocebus cupreus]